MTTSKTMRVKVAKAFENAALVLSIPKWWTQYTCSRNKMNIPVNLSDLDGCSFCAIGALRAQSLNKKELILALATFEEVTGFEITAFNDTIGTTNKNVAVACWESAQRIRANNT